MDNKYQFTYKGVEYDATEYAPKHPGGLSFLQNMRNVKKDFTEYFRYTIFHLGLYIRMMQKKF